jgi:C-terminal processing protease CtpA/Prc
MNRILKSALPLAFCLVATAALAGGADCAKADKANMAKKGDCTMSAEDCQKAFAESKNRGWLGIEGENAEGGGWLVKNVVPGSPAAAAGFKSGDVLYALNGVTINEANHDKIKAIKKDLKPGSQVTYTVKRGDSETRLAATLGTMPDKVYQTMVAEHMKEHEAVATAR